MNGLLPPKENKEPVNSGNLEKLYVFALMWSFGAFLELDDRKKFQDYLETSGEFKLNLPPYDGNNEETIFDYYVNEKAEWKHWSTKVDEYIYPSDHTPEYGSILVPNVDNVRTDFLIKTISKQNKVIQFVNTI